MQDDSTSHSCAFDVIPSDIDHMGHVNNTVYLRWIQEAVISFWHRIAPDEAVTSIAWVAIKHEITYRCPAFLDQQIDVVTFAERLEGAKAHFIAIVRRGETVLAEARSVWCSVDAASLRPVRLAKEVRNLILPV